MKEESIEHADNRQLLEAYRSEIRRLTRQVVNLRWELKDMQEKIKEIV